jgi:drug/metabolite transporter (DMT)-like permease
MSSEEAVMKYPPARLPAELPGGVTAGIDWASEDHAVCVLDAAGVVVTRFTVQHTAEGLRDLVQRLASAGAAEAAIERGDGPAVDALLGAGVTVVVITPPAVRGRAWLAVAAMLAAVTLWGPSFVATKVALRDLPPLTVAFLRFLVASCVLFLVWRRSPQAARLDSATHWRLFVGGLLGVAGYFILENLGVQRTTASDAALLMAAIPVIALLAEALWLKQPISLKRGAGIAVSFAAVFLLIGRARAAGGSNRVAGDLLVVAAAFLWAAYSLHGKSVNHVPKLTVVTYEAIYGTLLLAPCALVESPQWRTVSPTSALAVAYLGVMCSAATYLLYNYALKTLAASQVTAFLNLVPIAGAGAAVLLLGEHLQPAQLLGGAVILAGVALSTAAAPARGAIPLSRGQPRPASPGMEAGMNEHAVAGRCEDVPARRAMTPAGHAVDDAFYQPGGSGPDGDRYLPTPLTAGPRDPGAQHAGPPIALVATAIERHRPRR